MSGVKPKQSSGLNMPKIILISVGAGLLMQLLVLSLVSLISVDNLYFNCDNRLFPIITAIISGFICGLVYSMLAKRNGMMGGLFSGAVLSFIMIILGMIFFTTLSLSSLVLVPLILVVVFSMAGGIFGVNLTRKGYSIR